MDGSYFVYIGSCSITDIVEIKSLNATFMNMYIMIDIDLSNLDTSNVTIMSYAFLNCISLVSINFNNFNTSNVSDISYMFSNDISLEILDLSSFDISSLTNMNYMFYNCSNLKFINLINFSEKKNISLISTFDHIYKHAIINIDEKKCPNIAQAIKQKGLDIINITSFNTSSYKCSNSCIICSENWNELDNKCLKCDYNYQYELPIGEYIQCFKKCPFFWYYDNNYDKFICTNDSICPNEYPI